MPASIRCIQNCELVVARNEEDVPEKFGFGRWYLVAKVETMPDKDYVNIHLKDGGILWGVHKKLFDYYNVTFVSVNQTDEVQEAVLPSEEAEPSAPVDMEAWMPDDE
jgi:hypothetical protein